MGCFYPKSMLFLKLQSWLQTKNDLIKKQYQMVWQYLNLENQTRFKNQKESTKVVPSPGLDFTEIVQFIALARSRIR